MDFVISLYAACLFVLYKVTPRIGDASIFGFRKLTFIIAAVELPYLFSVIHDRDSLHPYVLAHITDFDLTLIKFLALKFLFLAAFSITAFHLQKKESHGQTFAWSCHVLTRTPSLDLRLALLMLFLTFVSFALLIFEVGGLAKLLVNWSNKTEVLQGTAIYRIANLVFGLLAVGFLINFIAQRKRIGTFEKALLAFFVTAVFLVLLSVGERKNPILLIIFAMMAWNFRVGEIKIASAGKLVSLLFFMVFASLFPELRKEGAMEMFATHPGDILVASIENWGQLFARLSDVETSLFVYSHFDELRKFWFGSSWPDLITGLIPSAMFPNKPPIDEGVYIYALAHYENATPPMPLRELTPVGWPLSRVTGPFVHFGVIGVLVGGLITGWLMRLISKITFKSRSPASLLVYIWTMWTGFGLTNAFVFNLSAMLVLLLPIHWFYRSRERKLVRLARQNAPTTRWQTHIG